MKTIKLFLIVVLYLWQCYTIKAQVSDNITNSFDMEYRLSIGYSGLNVRLADIKPPSGVGFNAGINAEWVFSTKWLISTGAGISFDNFGIAPFTFSAERNLIDTEGEPFNMHYTFNSFSQSIHTAYLQLPLFMGYKSDKLYAMAGVKYGFPLYANYSTIINPLVTTGEYVRFIDTFEKMPNHYLVNKREIYQDKTTFKQNTTVGLRFGYQFRNRGGSPFRFVTTRIGLFCDMGIADLRQPDIMQEIITYNENPVNIHPNNILYTNINQSEKIRSFTAGIEFCFLIRYNSKFKCMCD